MGTCAYVYSESEWCSYRQCLYLSQQSDKYQNKSNNSPALAQDSQAYMMCTRKWKENCYKEIAEK